MLVSLFGTKVYSVIRSRIIQTSLALQTHRLIFSSSSAVVGVRCRRTHPFKEFQQAISSTATAIFICPKENQRQMQTCQVFVVMFFLAFFTKQIPYLE